MTVGFQADYSTTILPRAQSDNSLSSNPPFEAVLKQQEAAIATTFTDPVPVGLGLRIDSPPLSSEMSPLSASAGYPALADGSSWGWVPVSSPVRATSPTPTSDPLLDPSSLPPSPDVSGSFYASSYDSALQPAPGISVGPGWYLRIHADPSEEWNRVEYATSGGLDFKPLPCNLYRIDGPDITVKIPAANDQNSPDFQKMFSGQSAGILRLRVWNASFGSWSDQWQVAQPDTRIFDGGGGYVGTVSSTGVFAARSLTF
jgi:hypothetical protein